MPYSHFSPTGKNDGNRKDAAFDKLTYLCLYTEKSRVGTSVTSLSPNGSVYPHNSRNRRSILEVVLLSNARKSQIGSLWHPNFSATSQNQCSQIECYSLHCMPSKGCLHSPSKNRTNLYLHNRTQLSEKHLNLLCLKTVSRCCAISVLVSVD